MLSRRVPTGGGRPVIKQEFDPEGAPVVVKQEFNPEVAPVVVKQEIPSSSAATAVKPAVAPPQIQEFSIRVPKTNKKRHNVMRFNAVLKVEFKEWEKVKLERENNMKDFRGFDEDMPKFGAGSEFGRDAREEARKKKFGINSRKYKSEDQPWILKAKLKPKEKKENDIKEEKMDKKDEKKAKDKKEQKYKGIREGGVGANASYYVFTHAPDGAIEAFPLHEWYNFQPIQRYKALSAEEAEEEFNRRNKTMNYFSLMMKKRLRNDEDDHDDGEVLEGKKKTNKKVKELKISEMDEWIDSDEEDSDEDEEDKKKSDDEDDKKKKKKDDIKKKKKKKKVSDDEAFEDSDDGDEEGRECDYISDSSASEDELESQKEIKSVDQEDALRKLLASDEEDEEEDEDKKDEDENEDEEGKQEKEKDPKEPTKKKDKKKKKKKDDGSDSSSDMESGPEQSKDKKPASTQSSRSATPIISSSSQSESQKRSHTGSPDLPQAKKSRLESGPSSSTLSSTYVPGSSESGITEDAVRRYLMRKPMTTIELLQKFKSKKTGLTSEQIVTIMTNVLKNVKPTSQKIKGKMYFSIKAQPNNKQ